jgi:transcriptional regulator with XRE-family HTH domain
MSIAIDTGMTGVALATVPPVQPSAQNHSLHRLRQVRISERISRRTMASRLDTDVQSVALQEDESADLPLSILYKWREALDVPMAELLVEEGTKLSRPVLWRSQMLRVMKTTRSILEQTKQIGIRRMAENLVEQLIEMMPELKGGGPWPAVGKRRSLNELGQAAWRSFPSSRYPELEE